MSTSKKYQKDYSNVKFDNPRITRQKETRKKRFSKFVISLIVVAVIGSIYALFFSPFFSISSIEIDGLDKIKKENLDRIIDDYRSERRFFIISKNNFWYFNKQDLIASLNKHYVFDELKIKKRLPDRVIITLKEKQSAINWMVGSMCYHLDLTGTAIEYCESGDGLITIRDLLNGEVEVGMKVIEADDLKYIMEVDQQARAILKDKYLPLFYEKNLEALTAKMESGPELRFNSQLGIGEQVSRLDLLLKDSEVKDNYNNLIYIDLRFGERVFYK